MAKTVTLNVTECPRCGTDHGDLEFKPFSDVPGAELWALCPDKSEPIIRPPEPLRDDRTHEILEGDAEPEGGFKKITDWFDQVYLINCKHRSDRLEESEAILSKSGVADWDKVQVYPAIIGDYTGHPAGWGGGNGAWGCILPDNRVQGRIRTASKARYTGDAVRLVTRSGARVTVTVNHPILTEKGFVRAGALRQGVNLMRYNGGVESRSTKNDVEDKPPLVREMFDSLVSAGLPIRRKSRSPLDFYGDGESIHGEVEIVDIDGDLPLPGVGTHTQGSEHNVFLRGHQDASSSLPRLGPANVRSPHLLPAPLDPRAPQVVPHRVTIDVEAVTEGLQGLPSGVTLPDFPQQSGGKFTGSGRFYGIGSAADLAACFDKEAFSDVRAEIELARQLLDGSSGVVELDELIGVDVFHYDGDVFDFGTTCGHFTVSGADCQDESGIIVSNCLQSHRRIMEDLMHKRDERGDLQWDAALILEDDVFFTPGALRDLHNFMNHVPANWGQIYLGGQHRADVTPTDNDFVVMGESVNRTHAYAMSRHSIQKIYHHVSYMQDYHGNKHIDHQLELAHQRHDWPVYCPTRWICGQREGPSNISGEVIGRMLWQ